MADPEKPSRVRWSTGVGLNQMHPVVAGRTVYFGDKSGNLQARDLATGELNWRYSASGPVQLAPAVRDGLVYVGTRAGYLRAIDAGSGEEQWSRRLSGEFTSTPVVTDDRVYIGFTRRVDKLNAEHQVHAFSSGSGDPLWTFSLEADENGIRDQPSGRPTPAVSGETLVVNFSRTHPDNRVKGLKASDGRLCGPSRSVRVPTHPVGRSHPPLSAGPLATSCPNPWEPSDSLPLMGVRTGSRTACPTPHRRSATTACSPSTASLRR
jgi:outer membrane protein assembly factor BamB